MNKERYFAAEGISCSARIHEHLLIGPQIRAADWILRCFLPTFVTTRWIEITREAWMSKEWDFVWSSKP